ncbi:MAG: TlpA disulfide reductase family protein [Bilophila sp.]
MRQVFLCALLSLALFAVPAFAVQPTTPAVQSAEIKAISAKEVMALATDNKGKVVFVNFFATWCPPCREEIPDLIALRKAYPADKVLFVGISLDDNPAKLQQFVQQMDFNYPVYRATGDVGEQFSITSIPHNLVFAKDGEVVANQPGMVTKADLTPFLDDLLKK